VIVPTGIGTGTPRSPGAGHSVQLSDEGLILPASM
jgi:hypothetical protein